VEEAAALLPEGLADAAVEEAAAALEVAAAAAAAGAAAEALVNPTFPAAAFDSTALGSAVAVDAEAAAAS
jgi:hypothetical protein